MPKALTINERLQRAQLLLADAQAIELPDAGQERGHLFMRKNSILNEAAIYARQVLPNRDGRPSHFGRGATDAQRGEAQRLLAAIEAARPPLLEEARREAKKIGRPRRTTETSEVVPVRLTKEEVEIAKAAGDGNLSVGIRRGLETLRQQTQ